MKRGIRIKTNLQKNEKTAKRESPPKKTDSAAMGILIGLAGSAYILVIDLILTPVSQIFVRLFPEDADPATALIGTKAALVLIAFIVLAIVIIKANTENKRYEAIEAERREKERAELHRQLDVIQEQLLKLSTHPHTNDAQRNVRKSNSHKSNTRKKR